MEGKPILLFCFPGFRTLQHADLLEELAFQQSVESRICQPTKNAVALRLLTPIRFAFFRLKAPNNLQFQQLLFLLGEFRKSKCSQSGVNVKTANALAIGNLYNV